MSDYAVALSTVPSREAGERLARALVSGRYAACVTLVPGAISIYRWKGGVERAEECLLVMKTRRDSFPALREALVKSHPYEVPEVLSLPIEAGYTPYLAWIDGSVRGPRRPGAPKRDPRAGPRRPRSRR
jgi:periplasmic divalent cation tolerance protein